MGRKKKTAEEYNEEYAGKVYGDVRIDEYSHKDERGQVYFYCTCLRCGVKFGPVQLGNLKSGGVTSCGHCLERTEIGNRYGHLVIKEFHHRDEKSQLYFLCECDCGNESVVCLGNLKSGGTTSCGRCLERTEIGNRYGHLVIKEFHHRDEKSQLYFLCECDCGNESVVRLGHLKSGKTTSCGRCLERTEIGNRYGHLVIKEFHHRDEKSQLYFLCECDCGEEKVVQLGSLKSGNTTSCGHCLERTEIGNRYGHLVIKEFHQRDEKSQLYFLCECDCGNESVVRLGHLKSGKTTSCGHCLERTEIGNRYGHLVIKEFHHRDEKSQLYFLCECDCGNESVVCLGNLKSGGTTSCGHCSERTEIGNRYGHLVIKEFHHRDEKSQLYFLCECDCGNESVVCLGNLKSGGTTSCGCRTESKGEEKIRLLLEKMGVKFEQEYLGFTDMRDKNVLRCDFWLPGFNRVIEFDGPQHFEPINMFGGERVFKDTQRRDQIKNQYCWDRGIDIVRIPYWEVDNFTMEDLVNKYSKYLVKEEKEMENDVGVQQNITW